MCRLRGDKKKKVELQKGAQLSLAMTMESLFEFLTYESKDVLKVKQLDTMSVQAKV